MLTLLRRVTVEPHGANEPHFDQLDGSAHPDQLHLDIELRQFRGPLPTPALLAQYEQVHPGLAERIVRMAESEQQHRHQLEQHDVEQPYLLARRGQWFAMTLAVLVLLLAAVMAIAGSPAAGTVVAALDITAVMVAFLYGRRQRADDDPAEPNQPG